MSIAPSPAPGADAPSPWGDAPPDAVAGPGDGPATPFALEWAAAAVLFVATLPVVVLAWALVRLTSPGPGLYSQTRVGRNGRTFRILKLRSMRQDAEAHTGAVWASSGDVRVTRFGRFLRATHLDELPQLVNILRGEMALVGPRPERPEVIASKGLAGGVPGYGRRLAVRPGVTGLAQVQLPADTDLASVGRKVQYDIYMMTRGGPGLVARVLVATLLKTVGVGVERRRRLCGLPDRATVEAAFRESEPHPAGVPDLILTA